MLTLRRALVTVLALTAFAAGVFASGSALADGTAPAPPTLEGRWSAGPLTVRWVVGDWGDACGPRPSGGGEAATSVLIQQAGTDLVITGGGRTYSTTQCWEQYPGIQRTGHSASARSWKTTCRTAPSDPRQAALSTSLTATDDSISFYEAGQYQFVIGNQNCTASVGRYRTYSLVQRAGTPENVPAAPAPSATAAAPKKPEPASPRCANPGAPARLEVRPVKKLVRAGEEFTFRAIVTDAAGCLVGAKPTWTVESGGEFGEVSQAGTVSVHANATEGEIHLTASVGGRSAGVTVEIASTDRYDALLRSGAFNAAGEVDEAATVAIASQSIGAGSAVAEDRASGRKQVFVAGVGGLALLLVGASVFVVIRSRKAQAKLAEIERDRRAKGKAKAERRAETPPPTQRSEGAPASAAPAVQKPPEPKAPPRTICPVCGTEFGPESKFCGKDGALLVPMN
ncbi:MAG TPA: hypothetical protein VHE30_20690 [Polyangiaceae bacterium]|nr:hypothetical protein [Polyangiaceae bacterium]